MANRIDFINDFTYIRHFYFLEMLRLEKRYGKKLDFQQFLANKSHKTTFCYC